MLKKYRTRFMKRKLKKYRKEVNRYFQLSKECKNAGDHINAMYCEAKAADLMYKEAKIINKLVRA